MISSTNTQGESVRGSNDYEIVTPHHRVLDLEPHHQMPVMPSM